MELKSSHPITNQVKQPFKQVIMKKSLLTQDEKLVLQAIQMEANKLGGGKIAYFEDVENCIGGMLTTMQIKRCIQGLKSFNKVHYFGNLDDCTQIIFI
jgi:hypothetical protein